MTMLLQEWRITWRVPMFRWACLALALLTIACLWNGQRFKADRDAQVRAEIERSVAKRSADRETLLRVEAGREPPPFWGAGEPNIADWNAARPSGPLAALSFGREDIQPFSANVSLFMVRADNLFRKFEFGSTYALAAGRFDAGFLVVLLLPLALLMLTYNVVAEERETGRLRLAAIQSSAFGRRLALRLLLRALPVFACLLVIAAAALLWGAPGGRLAVWTGSATLYLFFWLGVAAITAGLPWRQHVLALAGAGIWLVIAVLLPAMGGAIAEMIAPGPSAFVEINHVREASNRANLRINETLKGYVTEHPELQGDNDEYWPAKLYAAQRVVEAEVGPVLANRAVIQARHDLWTNQLRFLSPTAALDQVLTDAAGTGRKRQQAYVDQAQGFLRHWGTVLSPMIFRQTRLTSADTERLPVFSFQEPNPPTQLIGSSLLYLLGAAGLALAWGYRKIVRLDR